MWKTKWNYKGKGNPKCALYGCSNVSEVGGHMQYKRQVNAWVYILPICKRCNNARDDDDEGWSLHHDGVAGRAIVQRGYRIEASGDIKSLACGACARPPAAHKKASTDKGESCALM
ncbi:hypothetical protein WJX79_006027 [Trebouxia sp. C0005]